MPDAPARLASAPPNRPWNEIKAPSPRVIAQSARRHIPARFRVHDGAAISRRGRFDALAVEDDRRTLARRTGVGCTDRRCGFARSADAGGRQRAAALSGAPSIRGVASRDDVAAGSEPRRSAKPRSETASRPIATADRKRSPTPPERRGGSDFADPARRSRSARRGVAISGDPCSFPGRCRPAAGRCALSWLSPRARRAWRRRPPPNEKDIKREQPGLRHDRLDRNARREVSSSGCATISRRARSSTPRPKYPTRSNTRPATCAPAAAGSKSI